MSTIFTTFVLILLHTLPSLHPLQLNGVLCTSWARPDVKKFGESEMEVLVSFQCRESLCAFYYCLSIQVKFA